MPEAQVVMSPPFEPPWRASARAARANLVPGLILWSIGVVIVAAYYFHAPTHAALERFASLRDTLGLFFPAIGTMLGGVLLPMFYLRRDPVLRQDYGFKNCVFLLGYWAYKGVEIELWYRVLNHFIGSHHDLRTIATKAFLDQALYSPFFAVPITVIVLTFNHVGLKAGPIIADFRAGHWYRRHVLPTLFANAIIWIPVVCLVYALPLSLQVILFDLVLCFFILIAAHITRRRH